MNPEIEIIKNLYQSEIEAYKKQVEDLKAINNTANEKNSNLLEKVHQLTDIIEQAKVTNDDLVTAFDHIREENLKLQAYQAPEKPIETSSRAHEALESLQAQSFDSIVDKISWISAKDKLYQKIKFLERECERHTRDNNTLAKQVRHLIRALEEERGMIIKKATESSNRGTLMSGTDVIDEHLVTFESIEELQKQNQRLLSLVKELSKREEDREMQLENEDITRLNNDIKELKSQLESVSSDRERILNSFNTIIKERDLFKILLTKTRQVEHLTAETFQRMVSIACTAGPAITTGLNDAPDQSERINDLKNMMDKLERENRLLRDEISTNEARAADEIRVKTDLLIETQIKNANLDQSNEQITERNQLLESNLKSLESEFEETRTKSQKMAFEIEKLMEQNQQLTKEISESRQRIEDSRAAVISLERMNADLRNELETSEARLSEELGSKSDLLEEAQGRIEDLNERIEDLTSAVERLEQENCLLREDMSTNESQAADEISTKMNLLMEAHNKITMLESTIDNLKQENCSLRQDVSTMKSKSADEISIKTNLLMEAHNKITMLESTIDNLKQENCSLRHEMTTMESQAADEVSTESDQLMEADHEISLLTSETEESGDQTAEAGPEEQPAGKLSVLTETSESSQSLESELRPPATGPTETGTGSGPMLQEAASEAEAITSDEPAKEQATGNNDDSNINNDDAGAQLSGSEASEGQPPEGGVEPAQRADKLAALDQMELALNEQPGEGGRIDCTDRWPAPGEEQPPGSGSQPVVMVSSSASAGLSPAAAAHDESDQANGAETVAEAEAEAGSVAQSDRLVDASNEPAATHDVRPHDDQPLVAAAAAAAAAANRDDERESDFNCNAEPASERLDGSSGGQPAGEREQPASELPEQRQADAPRCGPEQVDPVPPTVPTGKTSSSGETTTGIALKRRKINRDT